eukprot:35499_1
MASFSFIFCVHMCSAVVVQNVFKNTILPMECGPTIAMNDLLHGASGFVSTPMGHDLIVLGWRTDITNKRQIWGSIYNHRTNQFDVPRFQVSMSDGVEEHRYIDGVMVTPNNKYIIFTWHRWVGNMWPLFHQRIYAGTNHSQYRLGYPITNNTAIQSTITMRDFAQKSMILNNNMYVTLWTNQSGVNQYEYGENLYVVLYDIQSATVIDTLQFGDRVDPNDQYSYGGNCAACLFFDNSQFDTSGSFFVVSTTYVDGVDTYPWNVRVRKYRNNVELTELVKIEDLTETRVTIPRCTHLPDSQVVIVCGWVARCAVLDDKTLQLKYGHSFDMQGIFAILNRYPRLATINLPYTNSLNAILCSRESECYIMDQNLTYLGYGGSSRQALISSGNWVNSLEVYAIHSTPGQFYVAYMNHSINPMIAFISICSVYTNSPTMDPTNYPSVDPTIMPTFYPTISPSNYPTNYPSVDPTIMPTYYPTISPSYYPSVAPTYYPTISPSYYPSMGPSYYPTNNPSTASVEISTYTPSKKLISDTQQSHWHDQMQFGVSVWFTATVVILFASVICCIICGVSLIYCGYKLAITKDRLNLIQQNGIDDNYNIQMASFKRRNKHQQFASLSTGDEINDRHRENDGDVLAEINKTHDEMMDNNNYDIH